MKIGIYDPYLDDLGGGEKYMLSIAKHLVKENAVDVFWDKREDFENVQKRFSLNLEKVGLVKNIFSNKTSIWEKLFITKKYDVIICLSDGSLPIVLSQKLFIHIQQPLDRLQTRGLTNKVKLKKVSAFFCNSSYTSGYLLKSFGIKSIVINPGVEIHKRN